MNIVLENSTPGGLAYIWQSEWVGIVAIKTETTQIHFWSDVFAAFASSDRKVPIRKLKERRRQRKRERQKSNRIILVKQLCTCIALFRRFLCRLCTTTTWKSLISRFVENGNTEQQISFSFPELWYKPLEINSKKITNIWRIKRDRISAIKFEEARLFQWRFRSRHRPCCLKLSDWILLSLSSNFDSARGNTHKR